MRFFLFLLLCMLAPVVAVAERRVALVVGIDKYDDLGPQAQLAKARSDAAAVAAALRDLDFDVIAKDDVTRSAFNRSWQDFLNKLAPGDTAAFYFVGHGVEFGGRSYLLPRDVPNIKPGRDEMLRREALSLQEFLADLRERGTRLNLVILDACRDNPFEQMGTRSVGSRRGLGISEPPKGTFIMYSAGAGESALDRLDDRDRNPNSVYTRHLLPLLRTQGLPLTEVAEQVRVAVYKTAATVQHQQTPAYYSHVLGRVCLAGGDCAPPLSGAPAPQPSEAERAWGATKDTTSIPALEAFIRRFGDTYYGDLAKVRLAELRQAEAANKRADEAARTKAEAERLALLQQKEAERQRVQAETERLALLQQKEAERQRANAEAARGRTDTDARGEHRVALIVGNSSYRTADDLKNPVANAAAIQVALFRLNFKLYVGQDLTLDMFREKMDVFTKAMKGADIALLFYAGRAVQFDNKTYLLPTDIELKSKADLFTKSILLDNIVVDMGRHAKASVIFLDACRDSPKLPNAGGSGGGILQTLLSDLAPISQELPSRDLFLGFVTSPGTCPLDGSRRNSPFTTALLRHIATPDVDIGAMFAAVRRDVITATSNSQHPEAVSRLARPLYLNPKGFGGQIAPSMPNSDDGVRLSAEGERWMLIKDSSDPKTFEEYLRDYPNGRFATLAKKRIDRLRSK